MTLDTLLRDARRACLPLEPTERFDAWLRVWRPAAMALMRKDGLFQGSHLNAWLKIADRLLDACLTKQSIDATIMEPAKVTPAQPNHSAVRARIFRALAGSTKTRRRRVD